MWRPQAPGALSGAVGTGLFKKLVGPSDHLGIDLPGSETAQTPHGRPRRRLATIVVLACAVVVVTGVSAAALVGHKTPRLDTSTTLVGRGADSTTYRAKTPVDSISTTTVGATTTLPVTTTTRAVPPPETRRSRALRRPRLLRPRRRRRRACGSRPRWPNFLRPLLPIGRCRSCTSRSPTPEEQPSAPSSSIPSAYTACRRIRVRTSHLGRAAARTFSSARAHRATM